MYTNTEDDTDGVCYLAVWGDYLYFDGYPANLKRIPITGGEPEDLVFDPFEFILDNGWIYYTVDGSIWRYRCADGFNQKILENPHSKYFLYLKDVDGDTLYYKFYDDLYCCALNGSNIQPISLPVESYETWRVQDGWVYYAKPGRISRCRPDGSEDQLLAEDPGAAVYGMVIRGEWLYYECGRCRVKLDGSRQEELIPEEDHFILQSSLMVDWDIVGDYCYLGLQEDDANWYDMVRYPLASLEKRMLSGGQHTQSGPWEHYDEAVYEAWEDEFYNLGNKTSY